jgi:thioredoxin-like negative regulator of GroEL
MAKSNSNEKIIFCYITCEENMDIAEKYGIRGTPTFIFILNEEKIKEFSGAHEHKLREALNDLHTGTESKASKHMMMSWKRFNPSYTKPNTY